MSGCNKTAQGVKEGTSFVALDPAAHRRKSYLLIALAPDGVRNVNIRTEGGRSTTVLVVDNSYSYRAGEMVHATLVRH